MHDHRKLGRELELFDTDPLIGAGLPYWLPDGAALRHTLEEYVRTAERLAGYRHVYSPVLGKRELYEISGHWSHYSDDMFPPMDLGPFVWIRLGSRALAPHLAALSSINNAPSPSSQLRSSRGDPICLNPPPCDARHQAPLPDPA